MVSVEAFSRLIAGIYAAAITPQRWQTTLRDVHLAAGGTFGSLLMADNAIWSSMDTTLPEDAVASYAAHYCNVDHVLTAVGTGPVGAIRTGSELITPQWNSEFCTEWLRPNGIGDGLLVRVTDGPAACCFIVGSPRRTEAFDTPERLDLLTALVPHLRQALRTQAALGSLAQSNLVMTEALEAFRSGVCLVAAGARVAGLNSSAERILSTADGLTLRAGRLGAVRARDGRRLTRALHDAVSDEPAGRTLLCERPSGRRPYIVHVVPLRRASMAMVVIVDPEQDGQPAAAVLQRVYGLTETEIRVALTAAHGADPKRIAEELSVSLSTVRSHLQHVYDKTDTHRQADLVRLLLALGRQ